VTAFEYELHEVGPAVTGVAVAHPLSRAAEVLRAYREVTAGAPDELTLNAALRHAPDGSGEQLAAVGGCHLGGRDEALRDLRPLLELGDPVELELGPAPYAAVNSAIDAAYPRGALNYWKSSFLHALSDDAIDTIVERFRTCPSSMTVFVLEHLHGALTRVPVHATAVPHRAAGYNFLITSVWLDPAASDENVEWTRAAFAAVEPFTARRRYSNYIAADEVGERPVREAFGPNYERLAELKARYDPANLFRLNQNVRPRAS
jgi:FAD/FMN-containing dehydrogenase